MVVADEVDAVRRGASTAAPHLPRRERQGAVRRAGGSAAGPGHAGTPRFLPTYDNVELGHKDRSRIIGDPARDFVDGKAQWDAVFARGAVLVDGFVSAGWRLERDDKGGPATVVVLPVRRQPFTATERADIEAEARDLLRMAVPRAVRHDVRFDPV